MVKLRVEKPGALSRRLVMPAHLNDVIHWRDRAEGARGVAECLTTTDAQRIMLDIADSYEKLMQQEIDRLIAPGVKVG
jgi:hypothetical protein